MLSLSSGSSRFNQVRKTWAASLFAGVAAIKPVFVACCSVAPPKSLNVTSAASWSSNSCNTSSRMSLKNTVDASTNIAAYPASTNVLTAFTFLHVHNWRNFTPKLESYADLYEPSSFVYLPNMSSISWSKKHVCWQLFVTRSLHCFTDFSSERMKVNRLAISGACLFAESNIISANGQYAAFAMVKILKSLSDGFKSCASKWSMRCGIGSGPLYQSFLFLWWW